MNPFLKVIFNKERELFGQERDLQNFKLFISCNDKPEIKSTDSGTWRRLENTTIDFPSKFVEPDHEAFLEVNKNNPEYQYYYTKDTSIDNKISSWTPIFLSMLVERYKELNKRKFKHVVPKSVIESAMEYKNSHNIYTSFKNDRLVRSQGSKLLVTELFSEFKEYTRDINASIKNIKQNIFVTEMSRVMENEKCRSGNRYWRNWTITDAVNNDDDDEE